MKSVPSWIAVVAAVTTGIVTYLVVQGDQAYWRGRRGPVVKSANGWADQLLRRERNGQPSTATASSVGAATDTAANAATRVPAGSRHAEPVAALRGLFGANRSDVELLRMASASADPAVRALGLRFEFTQVVPSSGLAIALEELFDTPTPEEALAAAEFVGQHADQATRRLLSRKLIEASHPDGWGFAVALAKSGQTWALDEWAKNTELLVATNHDSTTLLLHLVLLSPSRATVRVGIAAAHSPGVTARLAAIRILRFGATREVVDTLRFLTQDRESSVRTAAQSELERRAKPNID